MMQPLRCFWGGNFLRVLRVRACVNVLTHGKMEKLSGEAKQQAPPAAAAP